MSLPRSQPRGLYMLFMTEMWERFSFYAMRALLVLYMTTLVTQGGLGWTNASSLELYGWYLGAAYITPILGGVVADRWLGQRYSVLLGGVLMAIGHILMAFNDLMLFYTALAVIALGNGFFKPNVTSMLGGLYERNDPRRDAGYAIFYMGINVGGVLAGISSAYLHQHYGFDHGFAAAALGMFIGLAIFGYGHSRYLGEVGSAAAIHQERRGAALTLVEKERLAVIAVLVTAVFAFMVAFEQAGGLLNLYADQWTDRRWGSYVIPSALFQTLNPIFVVLLSPLFSWIWTSLGRRNPVASVKIAIGLFLCMLGFILIWSLTPGDVMESGAGCHSFWLLPFYGLITAGEICILPVVWSAVSKLSPRQYASSLMACSLFATGLGGWAAGQLASYVDQLGPRDIFSLIALSCGVMGVVMLAVTRWLRRWSHGVE